MQNWQEFNLTALDQAAIPCYIMESKISAKGIIHIVHGMSEHGRRYDETAAWFSVQGFHVSAHDLRGHGKRIPQQSSGHLGDQNAWKHSIHDIEIAHQHLLQKYQLPVILLGHSLGSIMLQDYLSSHYSAPCGAILSGTTGPAGLIASLGRLVCWFESWRLGKHAKSSLIHAMSFKRYNARFKNTTSVSDWLSRHQPSVQKYLNDPLCGFECTVGTWSHVLACLSKLHQFEKIKNIPVTCPILLVSGDDDPVGEYGQTVRELFNRYRSVGLNTELKLYHGGRHEMLNETNREEVLNDCLQWVRNVI